MVILAMVCLLTSDVVNTAMLSKAYTIQDVQIFHIPKPSNYQATADSYAKYQCADAYLFFTSIWVVKGSFLAYYEDLTKRLTTVRRAWWATIVFTILTYIGSLFAYAFLDGVHLKTNPRNEAIKYQFSADLSTDVFSGSLLLSSNFENPRLTITYEVTIIPLYIALRSQTPLRQKLALAGIFSLSLIITIFSIIRFTLNSPDRGLAGPSWLQAWSIVEQSVSIIVACLASFRVFVIHKRRNSEQSSSRGRAKSKSHSNSQGARLPSVKNGISDLRSHWGNSASRGTKSMELQLLDATSSKSLAQVTASRDHEETKSSF